MSSPSLDFNIDYFDILEGLVVFIGLHVFDGMDDLKTAQHTSENRMLVVKPWRRRRRDEKLGPVGTRPGIGHAHGVWPIMPKLTCELIFELSPPDTISTGAVAQWIARLYHEFRDDAVEDDAFKVTAPRVPNEVLHRLWRVFREEAHVHVAHAGVYGRCLGDGRRPAGSSRGDGRDGLLVSCWALVEDVTITLVLLIFWL